MRADPCKAIPNSVSPSEAWVNWHKSLLKWFSKQEANQHWIRFWAQRAGAGTPADTHTLRDYMRTQGVDLTTDASGVMRDKLEEGWDWFRGTLTGIQAVFFGAVILAVALIAFYFIFNIRRGKQMSEFAADIRSIRGQNVTTVGSSYPSNKVGQLGNQNFLT